MIKFTPEAILSLIATGAALIATLLMVDEAVAMRQGRDPVNTAVWTAVRRFPRLVYVLAVVIGMLLGHLLWP
jgi:hypothetical protein